MSPKNTPLSQVGKRQPKLDAPLKATGRSQFTDDIILPGMLHGKIVRSRTICHVHDEENAAKAGDMVEIVESRPRSKTKRWELVRVVKSATEA